MPPRFYLDQSLDDSPATAKTPTFDLHETQAHHVKNVLRLKVGDSVEVFDGLGWSAVAVIDQIGRSRVTISIQTPQTDPSASRAPLEIAMPLPKGDRARFLVEKLTELGVDRLALLTTTHSVSSKQKIPHEKLVRYTIEACKQCRRNTLLQINNPIPLDDYLDSSDADALRFIAHPGGAPLSEALRKQPERRLPIQILIGPEGGFRAEEVALAESHGATTVSLGRYILRMETAALCAAALCASTLAAR